MKKKLIALVLLFALFFSTLSQGAEAKTKQKKLDYSKMPYLDTLIYHKDYKNDTRYSAARKYLKLLEKYADTQTVNDKLLDAESLLNGDYGYEITYEND